MRRACWYNKRKTDHKLNWHFQTLKKMYYFCDLRCFKWISTTFQPRNSQTCYNSKDPYASSERNTPKVTSLNQKRRLKQKTPTNLQFLPSLKSETTASWTPTKHRLICHFVQHNLHYCPLLGLTINNTNKGPGWGQGMSEMNRFIPARGNIFSSASV